MNSSSAHQHVPPSYGKLNSTPSTEWGLRIMDHNHNQTDTVNLLNEDPFTLESFQRLIELHSEDGKALIIARVDTEQPASPPPPLPTTSPNTNVSKDYFDPNNSNNNLNALPPVTPKRSTHFYYSAHNLNKVIFRTYGDGDDYLFRLYALNPLTNTPICGDIHYYLVVEDWEMFETLPISTFKERIAKGVQAKLLQGLVPGLSCIPLSLDILSGELTEGSVNRSTGIIKEGNAMINQIYEQPQYSDGYEIKKQQQTQQEDSSFDNHNQKITENIPATSTDILDAPNTSPKVPFSKSHFDELMKASIGQHNNCMSIAQVSGRCPHTSTSPPLGRKTAATNALSKTETTKCSSLDAMIRANISPTKRLSIPTKAATDVLEHKKPYHSSLPLLYRSIPHVQVVKQPLSPPHPPYQFPSTSRTPSPLQPQNSDIVPVTNSLCNVAKDLTYESVGWKVTIKEKSLPRLRGIESSQRGIDPHPPAKSFTSPNCYYKAIYIGNDDDFLTQESMRTFFRENALCEEDAVLYTIPSEVLLREGILVEDMYQLSQSLSTMNRPLSQTSESRDVAVAASASADSASLSFLGESQLRSDGRIFESHFPPHHSPIAPVIANLEKHEHSEGARSWSSTSLSDTGSFGVLTCCSRFLTQTKVLTMLLVLLFYLVFIVSSLALILYVNHGWLVWAIIFIPLIPLPFCISYIQRRCIASQSRQHSLSPDFHPQSAIFYHDSYSRVNEAHSSL